MEKKAHFHSDLFAFLRDLKDNNDRSWFEANKARYESSVLEPSLEFITDFGQRLSKISPHFNAIPRKSGGSLFRIYRDVRFSKDKSPYKTQVGIHFRHSRHKDAHAPGFYLHLQPGSCFVGAGIWRPDSTSVKKIREAVAVDSTSWRRAIGGKAFKQVLELGGDSLKRPPRGFDPEHPCIDDIRRKDFIAVATLTQKQATAKGFIDEFAATCKSAVPLVRFLCGALEVEF